MFDQHVRFSRVRQPAALLSATTGFVLTAPAHATPSEQLTLIACQQTLEYTVNLTSGEVHGDIDYTHCVSPTHLEIHHGVANGTPDNVTINETPISRRSAESSSMPHTWLRRAAVVPTVSQLDVRRVGCDAASMTDAMKAFKVVTAIANGAVEGSYD